MHLQEGAGVIAFGSVIILLDEIVDVKADRARIALELGYYWRNNVE